MIKKQKKSKDNQPISEEQYLKKIKRNKIAILITQISIIVAFIAIWEIAAKLGAIDSFITSKPSQIIKTFINLSNNDLLEHLKITLTEIVLPAFFSRHKKTERSLLDCFPPSEVTLLNY